MSPKRLKLILRITRKNYSLKSFSIIRLAFVIFAFFPIKQQSIALKLKQLYTKYKNKKCNSHHFALFKTQSLN